MNAVGDIAYMAFTPVVAFPDSGEHLLGNLAVEPAYAVGFLAGVEGEDAHGEALVGIGVLAAHVHQVVPGDTELGGETAHVFSEESFVEVVVSGGNGGVDGIEAGSAYQLEGNLEVEVLFLHVVYKTLEVQQGGVSFVAVEEVTLDSEFLKHQHTADTEKIFLLDTVFPVTAIKLVGNGTVEFGVHLEIGVHQVEIHAAYVHAPYMAVNDSVVIRHFQNHGTAGFFHYLLDGELVEVLGFVVGNLLSVYGKSLGKVAEAVEETDSRHGNAGVGSLLYIVSGQYAETARIDFQSVAQTILHREVCYFGKVGAHRFGHIVLEHLIDMSDALHHLFVGDDLFEAFGCELLEEHHRIFAGGMPEVAVQVMEERLCFAVPYPPEVLGNLLKGLELRGEVGFNSNVAPNGGISVADLKFHVVKL